MRALVKEAGLEDQFRLSSAGTLGYHSGSLPDPRMRAAAARRGYELQSRAKKIQKEDFAEYTWILTMDEQNLETVRGLAPSTEARSKVRPLCAFCIQKSDTEVPDPYYGGPEGFEQVLDLLEDACRGLLKQLCPSKP